MSNPPPPTQLRLDLGVTVDTTIYLTSAITALDATARAKVKLT